MLSLATPPPLRQMSSPSLALVPKPERRGQYKPMPRLPVSSPGHDPQSQGAHRAILHERLRRQCETFRARERARARGRPRSSAAPSSDCDGDVNMDDDEADDRDIDLLADRIMELERRRALQSFESSFSSEVGSLPTIPDGELDGTEELPDDAYEDEELAYLYERYLQDKHDALYMPSSSEADSMMSDDFVAAQPFAQCPSCRVAWPVDASEGAFVCPQCRLSLPLADIASAWHAEHARERDPKHLPSLAVLPDGFLLLCGAADCDWTFDL